MYNAEVGDDVYGEDPTVHRLEEKAAETRDAGDGDLRSRILQFLDNIGESLLDPGEQALGMFDLVSRSFETMQNAIAAGKLAAYSPDVVIDVPRNACGSHEFHRAREMIDLGYRLASRSVSGR